MKRNKGEGTIFKDNSRNRWMAQYDQKIDLLGNTKRKTLVAKTKKEIIEKLNKALYDNNSEVFILKHGIPLVTIIKNLREQKFRANVISEGQYARMGWTIKKIEESELKEVKVADLTTEMIQGFLNNNSHLSNSYIEKLYELINGACKYALKNKYIEYNPVEDVMRTKSIKSNKTMISLNLNHHQKFLEYLNSVTTEQEKYKFVFFIQLYMGLRISEVLSLKVEDIDLKNNLLLVNKTLTRDKDFKLKLKSSTKTYAGMRELPIPKKLITFFKEQIKIGKKQKDNFLFLNNGNFISASGINLSLKRIFRDKLDLDDKNISSHCLRHTYATRCIESGINPTVLQRLLGHTDIKITLNTYTTVFNKFKQDELDKVDKYYENNELEIDM